MRHDPSPIARQAGLVVLALLCCLGAFAADAGAQERERLRNELERTDQILERARTVVEEHGNLRAREQLSFAFQLQERAKTIAFSPYAGLVELQRALELSLRARSLAERAVQIASQQAHLEQRAQQALERLERRLEEARAAAGDVPDESSVRTLELATRRLEQAREAFHEQRFQEVIGISIDTMRFLDSFVRPEPGQRLERILENTRHLLERAVADAGENARAQEILQRATTLLEQAEAQRLAGHPDAAERLVQQARELVLNAMRLREAPLDAGRVDLVLEETATYVDDAMQRVQDSASPEAVTLLENAKRHLERARELRLENKLQQALEEARVARNLARRAVQLAGVGDL